MKISIITPTRNGIESLNKMIESAIEKSSGDNEIEIILKMDMDDSKTINNIESISHKDKIKILIYDRRDGFGSLHDFINDMIKISNGDWLMMMNDDIRFLTDNWDKLFEEFDYNKPCIIMHESVKGRRGDIGDYYNPTISIKLLDIIKRIPTPAFDGYLLRLSKMSNIRRDIKLSLYNDPTMTYSERGSHVSVDGYNSWENLYKVHKRKNDKGQIIVDLELEKDKNKILDWFKNKK